MFYKMSYFVVILMCLIWINDRILPTAAFPRKHKLHSSDIDQLIKNVLSSKKFILLANRLAEITIKKFKEETNILSNHNISVDFSRPIQPAPALNINSSKNSLRYSNLKKHFEILPNISESKNVSQYLLKNETKLKKHHHKSKKKTEMKTNETIKSIEIVATSDSPKPDENTSTGTKESSGNETQSVEGHEFHENSDKESLKIEKTTTKKVEKNNIKIELQENETQPVERQHENSDIESANIEKVTTHNKQIKEKVTKHESGENEAHQEYETQSVEALHENSDSENSNIEKATTNKQIHEEISRQAEISQENGIEEKHYDTLKTDDDPLKTIQNTSTEKTKQNLSLEVVKQLSLENQKYLANLTHSKEISSALADNILDPEVYEYDQHHTNDNKKPVIRREGERLFTYNNAPEYDDYFSKIGNFTDDREIVNVDLDKESYN